MLPLKLAVVNERWKIAARLIAEVQRIDESCLATSTRAAAKKGAKATFRTSQVAAKKSRSSQSFIAGNSSLERVQRGFEPWGKPGWNLVTEQLKDHLKKLEEQHSKFAVGNSMKDFEKTKDNIKRVIGNATKSCWKNDPDGGGLVWDNFFDDLKACSRQLLENRPPVIHGYAIKKRYTSAPAEYGDNKTLRQPDSLACLLGMGNGTTIKVRAIALLIHANFMTIKLKTMLGKKRFETFLTQKQSGGLIIADSRPVSALPEGEPPHLLQPKNLKAWIGDPTAKLLPRTVTKTGTAKLAAEPATGEYEGDLQKILDAVRLMLVTATSSDDSSANDEGVPEAIRLQKDFLKLLTTCSTIEFKGVRTKSTMDEETAEVKQSILNFSMAPKTPRGRKMTFQDMLNDEHDYKLAVETFKDKNRDKNSKPFFDTSELKAATELFESETISMQPITMVIEIQFYMDWFLHERELCHVWYKIVKPTLHLLTTVTVAHLNFSLLLTSSKLTSRCYYYYAKPALMLM